MIRKSISVSPPTFLLPKDKRRCHCIANYIILQCLAIFMGSITVLYCFWNPLWLSFDLYKLASIMYLYDKKACGYSMQAARSVANLQLSNDTMGLDVLPIKWKPALVTVSTRLSAKTRKYIKVSLAIHVCWMAIAILFRVSTKTKDNLRLLTVMLTTVFYSSIFVIVFDLSMAIVYLTHIKQSLTKGMIIRHSGWSVELQLDNYDDFAGWLPIVAALCWMRGGVFLGINVYSCRIMYFIKNKIKKRQIITRFVTENHMPIPAPNRDSAVMDRTLYYRAGEPKPYFKKDNNEAFV